MLRAELPRRMVCASEHHLYSCNKLRKIMIEVGAVAWDLERDVLVRDRRLSHLFGAYRWDD